MAFPSSHAVNNFGVAAFMGWYYRRGRPWLYAWAAIVAISRPAVGVHYPSDILGGAVIGTLIGLAVAGGWTMLQKKYIPRWSVPAAAERTT